MEPTVDLSILKPEQMAALVEMRRLFEDMTYPDQSDPTSWFRLNDWTFLRYLRARSYNVAKAETMLRDTLEFRNKYAPNLLKRDDPAITLGLSHKVWRLLGVAKDGSPAQMTVAGMFDPSAVTDEEGFVKTVVFESETILREMQKQQWRSDKTLVIFDLENYSLLKQATPTGMRLLKQMLEISEKTLIHFQVFEKQIETNTLFMSDKHYPELLGQCFIYGAPFIFRGVWAVIRPWLDADTASRVFFVTDNTKLLELVDSNVLMERHGGTRKKEYGVLYFEEDMEEEAAEST